MTAEYRKLPGKRRGFFNVSSVWAGSDHLLLVRGTRFREEYKRFYYRDVQAIALARAPRFHISARSGLAAALIFFAAIVTLAPAAFLGSLITGHSLPAGLGFTVLAIALPAAWIYVSAAQSCRCRIYTAVSSDELPSVYRMWTARKFLAEVEPLIAQTQGTIEGDWAAAAEERAVGPAFSTSAVAGPAAVEPVSLPSRVLASDLLLASLAADALARLLRLPAPITTWLIFATELLTAAAAVSVMVQYNRGRIRSGLHWVAVASLLSFGIFFYVTSLSAGITAGLDAAKTGKKTIVVAYAQTRVVREVNAGMDAILLIAGLVLSLRGEKPRPSSMLGGPSVN